MPRRVMDEPRSRHWHPVLLVGFTLLLMWSVPVAFDTAVEQRRERVSHLDQARTAIAEMQLAHALQVAAVRARGLPGAEALVAADLAEHERRDGRARRALAVALVEEPPAGPVARDHAILLDAVLAWHRHADAMIRRDARAAATPDELVEQQRLYRGVLIAADNVERQLAATSAAIREDRQRLSRVERAVVACLGTLALLAVAIVSRLAARVDAERRLARRDPLTGLPNRRELAERFELEQSRASRTGHPLTLVLLDLDGFKKVNDVYGHQRGDVVLAAVARAMAQALRELDVIARLGGDEFAMLLVGIEEPRRVLERVRAAARAAAAVHGVELDACIGALPARADDMDLDVLLRRADALMYEAKRGGRGQVRVDGSRGPPAALSRSP